MSRPHELYQALEVAIDSGAPNSVILELIKPVLCAMALAETVDQGTTKLATRHPQGFYTLYLAPNVALHYWPRDFVDEMPFPDKTVSDEHGHGWHMKARILLDTIVDRRIQVEEIPGFAGGMRFLPNWAHAERYHRIFDAQSGRDGWDYMLNTNRIARITSYGKEVSLEAGQSYSMRIGEFHTTSWEADSITVMLADPVAGAANPTLGPLVREYDNDQQVESHFVKRYTLPPKETARLAGYLATKLGIG